MNRRRAFVIAAVLAIAVAAVAVAVGRNHKVVAQVAQPGAPALPLATAHFGTLMTHVLAQGRVGAPAGSDAKLSFAAAGIVATVVVHVGDRVTAGEALASLDTTGFAIDAAQAEHDAAAASALYGGGAVPQQAVASALRRLAAARNRLSSLTSGTGAAQSDATGARDALRQAQAKVAADQRTLAREQALFAGGVAAQKDVDAGRQQLALDVADVDAARAKAASSASGVGGALAQARADVAQAESDVRTAQAQVAVTGAQAGSAQDRAAAAQRNLANAVLRATNDGVVVSILKHPGEAVDSTQPAMVVGPPRSSQVAVTVTGEAALAIRAGAAALVTVPGRGLRAQATVKSVVPSVDPATQTSTVVLTGVPSGAASGDAVDVTINAGARRGILIPTDAIVEDPQTGRAVVFVRGKTSDGSDGYTSREITIATADGATSLVASGLRSGERIAAHGAFDLLAPNG